MSTPETRRGARIKQIIVATDGSPAAIEAVEAGLELAIAEGAAVTFVQVRPPDEWISGKRLGQFAPPADRAETKASKTALDDAAERAETSGVPYALERISDDAVHAIVALADARDADLIVVGSRGRRPLAAALLGSVSRGVLTRAERPVLVVRPPAAAS